MQKRERFVKEGARGDERRARVGAHIDTQLGSVRFHNNTAPRPQQRTHIWGSREREQPFATKATRCAAPVGHDSMGVPSFGWVGESKRARGA